jgi:hypothetical protein
MAGADLATSWTMAGPRIYSAAYAGQLAAASTASDYVTSVMDAQDGPAGSPPPAVDPSAFAGTASDGRPLASLLRLPMARTFTDLSAGIPQTDALAHGEALLQMLVDTEVADAGRAADSTAITADRRAGGYIRVVSASACGRCIILAGRYYRYSAGFARHPHCFPAGVTVSGPRTLAATRRRYEGELTIIRTAGGQELPATGNHPILTDRGWVPANLIQEGDHVVRSTRSQGAAALVVPHEQQVPSRIEDCWRPDGVMPLLQMPTAAEDFHGDGGHGDVNVVFADGFLGTGREASGGKLAEQEEFAGRIAQPLGLAQGGTFDQLLHGLLGAAHGGMGGFGLSLSLFGGLAPSLYELGLGHVTDFGAGGLQAQSYSASADAVPTTETQLALSGSISSHDFIDRNAPAVPRWDAPAGPFAEENRLAYAARGADLVRRLAGQVELDRVVEVRSVSWSGHVYNLTSAEGWYSANGLIVSNCHCQQVPAGSASSAAEHLTNPHAAFERLDRAQQDRAFTVAGAQAIRDGGDIFQVVNARRGLTTIGSGRFGRSLSATTEGTTRRGLFNQAVRASGRPAPTVRLTPQAIYRIASTRSEAVTLLRRYGYLL